MSAKRWSFRSAAVSVESLVRRPRASLIGLWAVALAIPGLAAATAAGHKAGDVVIESRSLQSAEGESVQFELGTLFVPENRAIAGSRIIGIGFVRMRSTGPAGAVPTFHLPGGPGDSYVDAFLEPRAGQPP